MSVDASRGRLYSSLKTLRLQWHEFEDQWRDALKADFERHTWEPLVQLTEEALEAMDRLSRLLAEMRYDCEGRAASE